MSFEASDLLEEVNLPTALSNRNLRALDWERAPDEHGTSEYSHLYRVRFIDRDGNRITVTSNTEEVNQYLLETVRKIKSKSTFTLESIIPPHIETLLAQVFYSELSNMLNRDMERYDLTQETLAEKLDVSQQAISAWRRRGFIPITRERESQLREIFTDDSEIVTSLNNGKMGDMALLAKHFKKLGYEGGQYKYKRVERFSKNSSNPTAMDRAAAMEALKRRRKLQQKGMDKLGYILLKHASKLISGSKREVKVPFGEKHIAYDLVTQHLAIEVVVIPERYIGAPINYVMQRFQHAMLHILTAPNLLKREITPALVVVAASKESVASLEQTNLPLSEPAQAKRERSEIETALIDYTTALGIELIFEYSTDIATEKLAALEAAMEKEATSNAEDLGLSPEELAFWERQSVFEDFWHNAGPTELTDEEYAEAVKAMQNDHTWDDVEMPDIPEDALEAQIAEHEREQRIQEYIRNKRTK